ncbi:hypothetical protein ANO11243_096560 [Dothideomycetidae sp. 11243]|nr:hypothetical protein ANO11243_096560 [fungal sp. No.11243]
MTGSTDIMSGSFGQIQKNWLSNHYLEPQRLALRNHVPGRTVIVQLILLRPTFVQENRITSSTFNCLRRQLWPMNLGMMT